MIRDFSYEAKEVLLQYVEEVAASGWWENVKDTIGDFGSEVWSWFGQLEISKYINDVDAYHKKVIDKNDTTKKDIETIFSNVQQVDTKYFGNISHLVYVGNLLVKYITDMAESIDPNGGNFNIEKLKALLDADKEALDQAQMEIVKNLVEEEKVEEAAEYVDAITNYDLTYDEYAAMTEDEQLEYLNGVAEWVLALYPNTELEAGKYEITVPIGADMSVTYNVTVTGTDKTGSNSTVKITLEEQKIVLKSAYKLKVDNLSAAVDSDGVSVDGTLGDIAVGTKHKFDGTILVNGVITNGESKAKIEAGTNGVTASMKFEVTTELEDDAKVSSSVKVEKANNTNMPEWEPVPVAVEEEDPEPISYEIDGEDVVEGVTIAAGAVAVYECVKWGVALALAPETGGMSLEIAMSLP